VLLSEDHPQLFTLVHSGLIHNLSHIFLNWVRIMAVQDHPRSLLLLSIESMYASYNATSYYSDQWQPYLLLSRPVSEIAGLGFLPKRACR